jgi:hypothetical protein
MGLLLKTFVWKQWEIFAKEEAILVHAITLVNNPSKNVQKFENQQQFLWTRMCFSWIGVPGRPLDITIAMDEQLVLQWPELRNMSDKDKLKHTQMPKFGIVIWSNILNPKSTMQNAKFP